MELVLEYNKLEELLDYINPALTAEWIFLAIPWQVVIGNVMWNFLPPDSPY